MGKLVESLREREWAEKAFFFFSFKIMENGHLLSHRETIQYILRNRLYLRNKGSLSLFKETHTCHRIWK